ncbi:hypothetical protein RRG08_029428 [Elysia crispata]|uniref:Uncharacterized protein n=1 Tax=Elysia crispata TaxID=231223 RepID=A0AAE1EDP0_9GAST|nr:hypothetical protein RRG08_029428 [Elysia crispata]
MAENDGQQVSTAATFDVPALSDLASDTHQGYYVQYWNEVRQAAEATGLAHCLSGLAESVTRHEVSDQAQADVVEAAKETVLEFCHDEDGG